MTHKIERMRVPFLPTAPSAMNSGLKRTTTALKDRHLATHPQPKRSTSHGIVKNAIKHTTDKPETETMATQSIVIFTHVCR
jgi:hypothetical protein